MSGGSLVAGFSAWIPGRAAKSQERERETGDASPGRRSKGAPVFRAHDSRAEGRCSEPIVTPYRATAVASGTRMASGRHAEPRGNVSVG